MNTILCNLCWTEVFPDFWWGLVVAGSILGTLCIVRTIIKAQIHSNIEKLKVQNQHEEQMKENAFAREKEWNGLMNIKACTDDVLKKQVEDLKKRIAKLEGELKTEKYNKGLLEQQLKLYSDIFAKLNVEIKPKENK